MRVKRVFVLAACCLFGAISIAAHGQAFPSKPVKIIVPFPPGGLTDILARVVASNIQPRWGTTVIVENRAGASGIAGSEQVVRAGDPHVLLLTAPHHTINPSLYKKLPYDTKRDFTPLALIATTPNVLFVHPAFPPRSVADLIKLAKNKPGSIGFASTGTGGGNHLAGEMFKAMAGIDMVHVPYKGEAPAVNDVVAGHVPLMFGGLTVSLPYISSGKLRALGVTTLRRLPALPDVPTLDESGLKGFEVLGWFGLYGPARLPAAVAARIAADTRAVLESAEVQARFEKFGVEPGALSQADFSRYVEREMDKWARVIEEAKIPKE